MDEQYNAIVDNITGTVNSICKDADMFDRMAYTVIKRLMDRFDITAEEALKFWTDTALEAFNYAFNGESEE